MNKRHSKNRLLFYFYLDKLQKTKQSRQKNNTQNLTLVTNLEFHEQLLVQRAGYLTTVVSEGASNVFTRLTKPRINKKKYISYYYYY